MLYSLGNPTVDSFREYPGYGRFEMPWIRAVAKATLRLIDKYEQSTGGIWILDYSRNRNDGQHEYIILNNVL